MAHKLDQIPEVISEAEDSRSGDGRMSAWIESIGLSFCFAQSGSVSEDPTKNDSSETANVEENTAIDWSSFDKKREESIRAHSQTNISQPITKKPEAAPAVVPKRFRGGWRMASGALGAGKTPANLD
eukprot:CAMPEP_0194219984 /NCGR_PEP_ID=MMETSP0156-20130528/27235_1 /TAXON_ID=33649 /ORGANISM="Thalassionema nitzschioides, Strain L26-B" /LENGTH=126 /DNA_ID=CAMNT_0038949835 /DNA_START=45 /DNA_END=425 /DNA_ORIENTATION=-